jgi:hypothetical protein
MKREFRYRTDDKAIKISGRENEAERREGKEAIL